METIKEPMVEYGVAKLALPGHDESGDRHLVRIHVVILPVTSERN